MEIGRWTIRPIDVRVELKRLSGARFVHGSRLWETLSFPTNEWVGFDFSVCDLVEPLGKGKTPHVFFFSESSGTPPWMDGATPAFTNWLTIRSENGGFCVFRETGDSDSPFRSVMPETPATNAIRFAYARSPDAILENSGLAEDEYIGFRTGTKGRLGLETHCGIIRRLGFSPGELEFEYFFNPEDGDSRIDADVRSKKDLGR